MTLLAPSERTDADRHGDGRLAGPRLGRARSAPGRDAGEGLRHLAGVHVGRDLGPACSTPPTGCWPSASTPATGSRSRPRTAPSGSSSTSPPSPCRGITVGLYPTNPAAEVEYLLDRLRRRRPPRRGPGAGRQGRSTLDRRSSSPALRTIVYLEPRGLAGLRRRPADVVGGLPRARAQPPRRARRRRRRAHGGGRARRRDDARLHVGDDRPAEGRHADERQRRVRHREDRHASRAAAWPASRPTSDDVIVTYLPLCHVAERIFSTWHLVSCGCGPQLRRVDRHHHRQPPRGPADAVLRRAPDLGEDPRRRADPRPTTPPG